MHRTVVGTTVHNSYLRLDVPHAVDKVCRKVAAPTRLDLRRLKRLALALYLFFTKDATVRIPTTAETNVVCWVDSDWADDVETRRSVGGGLLTPAGVPIGSCARTQATPALSSWETEVCATGSGCAHSLGSRSLVMEMEGEDLGENPH